MSGRPIKTFQSRESGSDRRGKPASLYLGSFGSFPEARRVIGESLVTMLPSLVLGHVIFAKGLAAILTLLVQQCYTAAFGAFFQVSNQRCTELHLRELGERFKLEPRQVVTLDCDSTSGSALARVSHDCW
jgi:hypothetical protein